MKRILLIIPLLFGLLGCVESMHPFYKESQLFYDPNLAGTWTDEDRANVIKVVGNDKDKDYSVVYTDEHGKTGQFVVHLAKVQDHLIADVYPDDLKGQVSANDAYQLHLVPVHSFLIVEYSPPDVRVRTMNLDWFNKYVEAHPKEIQVETVDSDRRLINAPTEQVQTFVLHHLATPGAYGEPQNMVRIPDK